MSMVNAAIISCRVEYLPLYRPLPLDLFATSLEPPSSRKPSLSAYSVNVAGRLSAGFRHFVVAEIQGPAAACSSHQYE